MSKTRYEIFKENGFYYFELKDDELVILRSEPFTNKKKCKEEQKRVMKNAKTFKIIDKT